MAITYVIACMKFGMVKCLKTITCILSGSNVIMISIKWIPLSIVPSSGLCEGVGI